MTDGAGTVGGEPDGDDAMSDGVKGKPPTVEEELWKIRIMLGSGLMTLESMAAVVKLPVEVVGEAVERIAAELTAADGTGRQMRGTGDAS